MTMETVRKLNEAGFFGPLDVQLADLAARMAPEADAAVALACALASRAIRQGHACVDLADYAGKPWQEILKDSRSGNDDGREADEEEQVSGGAQDDIGTLPPLASWMAAFREPVAGDGSKTGDGRTLLILEGTRLYVRRYWEYERNVEKVLESLNTDSGSRLDEAALDRYFGREGSGEQKEAIRKAVQKRLSLLSGGPGTGKTYTIARAVALFGELHRKEGKTPVVHLVAPTGKAAVRMVESIKKARQDLVNGGMDEALVRVIPEQASTIHRLLGARYQSPYFKHDSRNPLAADMVIVDEASMVDLPLMAKLLDALPGGCALMLVGDVAQLASVEPGRVYGDVCGAAKPGGPLDGCLSHLTTSRRFPADSAIGRISPLINGGRAEEAWQALQEARRNQDLRVLEGKELDRDDGEFSRLVAEHLGGFMGAKEPAAALAAADKFRVLCAVRKGPYGVGRMNRRVEQILSRQGLKPSGRFYDHQLIMIRVNTPALNLFNGDVGVVLAGNGQGREREYSVWFPDPVLGARSIPVSLLPDHETAFAMTVHKAQGSEFPYVAFILPDDAECPVLTRELLYTGMTRVKIDAAAGTGKLVMWCSKAGFVKAVSAVTTRATGLFRIPESGHS